MQNVNGMFRDIESFRCSNEVPAMKHIKLSYHQLEAESIFATADQPIASTLSQSVEGSVWRCFHFSAA